MPQVDWDAARAYFLSLGPDQRSYVAVAAEYKVSVKTVQKWAKRQQWMAQAASLDAQVSGSTRHLIVRTRAERVHNTLALVDAYLDAVIEKLAAKTLDVKASDVAALVKVSELLIGEPTDRIQVTQLRPLLDAYDAAVDELRSMADDQGRAARVVARLDEELLAFAAQARQRETT